MPNPLQQRRALPFDEAIEHATRILIKCKPPGSLAFKRCGHTVVMRSADLISKLPNARTYGEVVDKLKCSRCGLTGWVSVRAAKR